MWYRSFSQAVGRVCIGTFLALMVALAIVGVYWVAVPIGESLVQAFNLSVVW